MKSFDGTCQKDLKKQFQIKYDLVLLWCPRPFLQIFGEKGRMVKQWEGGNACVIMQRYLGIIMVGGTIRLRTKISQPTNIVNTMTWTMFDTKLSTFGMKLVTLCFKDKTECELHVCKDNLLHTCDDIISGTQQ